MTADFAENSGYNFISKRRIDDLLCGCGENLGLRLHMVSTNAQFHLKKTVLDAPNPLRKEGQVAPVLRMSGRWKCEKLLQ